MNPTVPPWVRYALLGFLGFGLTNFLLGCIVEWSGRDPQASVTAPMLLWTAMGGVGLTAALVFRLNGRGLRGIPSRGAFVMAAVAGWTLALGMLCLKLGLLAEPAARGPLVAVASTNSLLVALLSRVLLGERLTRTQAMGFLVVLAGVVTIGLASGGTASLRGLGMGLLTMLCFGVTNTLLKLAGHQGTDSISAAVVLWCAAGVAGVLSLGTSFAIGRGLAGLGSPLLLGTALLAGLSLSLGMYGIKRAVTLGPGGPAAAITGSNAVLVTLLDRLVFGHSPSPGRLLGMALALAGIALLAMGGSHAHGAAASSPSAR